MSNAPISAKPPRVIGVIPAAGWATRLGLTDRSKEMLEVRGRPVMDYLVERMKVALPDAIRVITRPQKRDVIARSHHLGLQVMTAETRSAADSIEIASADLDPEDLVLIGFPDSIWEPVDGFRVLLDHLTAERSVVLGLFTSDAAERSDVVTVDDSGVVHQILAKPSPPPSKLIWACAVARRSALEGIGSFEYPGEHFANLCAEGVVGGVWLSDSYLDIGTRDALEAVQPLKDSGSDRGPGSGGVIGGSHQGP